MMPPSHWMPPPPLVMGGPFGRHASMCLFHFVHSVNTEFIIWTDNGTIQIHKQFKAFGAVYFISTAQSEDLEDSE